MIQYPLMFKTALSVLILVVSAMFLSSCGREPEAGKKFNIVILAVDTLRADHLGCYGYPHPASPRIDEFAKKSLFFENAFCTIPKTSASFASMLTGLHPSIHRTKPNRGPLNEKFLTLAELLTINGYHTAAVVDNANLSRFFQFDQGFADYTEAWTHAETKPESTPFITSRVLDFLGAKHEKPFFLWVNYIDPHTPYVPPAEFIPQRPRGRNLRALNPCIMPGPVRRELEQLGDFSEGHAIARYDGAVSYVDAEIGKVLDAVSRLGLDKDTVVIVTADHGEDLGERNLFFDHGPLTFTAGARIPLMMRIPGRKPRTVRTPVSLMDIYPTVLQLLRLEPPYPLQGVSLLQPQKDRLLYILGTSSHAVVRGRQHYVKINPRLSKRLHLPPDHFFDYFSDPRETKNLFSSQAAAARVLAARFESFLRAHGNYLSGKASQPQGKLSEKEKKSLETLGYL